MFIYESTSKSVEESMMSDYINSRKGSGCDIKSDGEDAFLLNFLVS